MLLFDADETLFDFNRSMRVALAKSLEKFDYPCGETEINKYEKINQGYWRRFENGEVTKEQVRAGRFRDFLALIGLSCDANKFDLLYLNNLAVFPYLIDGAEGLVAALSGRYRMSIITNGISFLQRKRIESSPICGYFEHVFISEELNTKKPDKEFFDKVFSVYKDMPRKKALVIGDSLSSDIKGGNNAGIDACWLNRNGIKPDNSIRIDYEVHSLPELKKLLLQE